jgi:quercetin dioxygenase-like cupin family protein
MDKTIVDRMDNGLIIVGGREIAVKGLPWNAHAKYQGTFVKDLVTGKDTGGSFSCHIIRMDAGSVIADHVHDGKNELNEVIGGSGMGILEGVQTPFEPGVVIVIPGGKSHSLTAGREGLYFLAKFVPALL